jgi:hypothetical protein
VSAGDPLVPPPWISLNDQSVFFPSHPGPGTRQRR